jgi:hypothetical protein
MTARIGTPARASAVARRHPPSLLVKTQTSPPTATPYRRAFAWKHEWTLERAGREHDLLRNDAPMAVRGAPVVMRRRKALDGSEHVVVIVAID